MCGVIGLLIREPALEPELGRLLESMVVALGERGPDSAGLAVYSRPTETGRDPGQGTVRVSLGSDTAVDWDSLSEWAAARYPGAVIDLQGSGARVDVTAAEADDLVAGLDGTWTGVHVFGTGQALSVIKDVGHPVDICRRHAVASWAGHLGIAHTRMATESAVTALHAHPFVPGPDLCIVHNGSFSNHATVRRRLRAEGVRFDSDNDSEVAARLLAQHIMAGDDLDAATRWVRKEMDGFFTLVVGTATGMSVVRDAFACKPAVVAVTGEYVAVASEYRALADLPGVDSARVFEPRPEEVYTWTV